ncbi:RraA family protein [Bradyrhizobium iriomotense]|uniref:RraA family protein n=1 Tax=Bradyrhizobium iriomotense TaxID=441950 RepID=UPI001B8A38BD|nr:RraA family protein [Bradyrhizobium iriomotense]MBR0779980.1 RraA family protein [Bradyrhizobium iriomotense]
MNVRGRIDEAIELLAGVETATIGHFRAEGFMRPDIQCVTDGVRIVGRALTVSLPADDGTALPHALALAEARDILVIERGDDDRHACWGAVMTAAALARGVTGVVIDGYVTDVGAIRSAGLPVWCRGRSPLTTKLRGGGSVAQPVTCGGVRVHAGDLVLADENGVCVLPPADAAEIAREAHAIQAREPEIVTRLERGESIVDVYGLAALPTA